VEQTSLSKEICCKWYAASFRSIGARVSNGFTTRLRNLSDVRNVIKGDIDTFLNAYLSVNPKK
jgi:hypothetical protein